MNSKEFRAELVKIMPGYNWTVHKSSIPEEWLEATGTQSSGSNRQSTLSVVRVEREGQQPFYEAKSSGYGVRENWLYTNKDGTLARALRGLQDHYEARASTYRSHANDLQKGRGKSSRDYLYINLLSAARQTLKENGHLADGDNCTLKALRDAVAEIDGVPA